MPVDTRKVKGRRQLDYRSYEELLADADRLAAGGVKTLGNWSAGQVFGHLANAYNASIDGFKFGLPWYLRLMARMFKKRLIAGAMPPGFNLPAEGSAIMVPGQTTTQDGLAELHAAVARLRRELHRARNPAFGEMTNEEWDRIHLHHASLHMSFLVPE